LKSSSSTQTLFAALTRLAFLFGLAFICFGTQYTHFLILFLYGRSWADDTETPYLLSWYFFFVAICAVNGVTEAFLQAVANDNETKSFNSWLLLCSFSQVCLSRVLLPEMGTAGLIAANSCVMLMRVTKNVSFARRHLPENTAFSKFIPSGKIILAFASSLIATSLSRTFVYDAGKSILHILMHLAIGGTVFVLVALFTWKCEQDLIRNLTGSFESRDEESSKKQD